MVQVIDDLVTENVKLQQQLTRKETELTRAEENIRSEQQQVRKPVNIHVCRCKWASLGFPRYVDILCTVVKTLFSLYRRLVSYSNSCNPVHNSCSPVRERKRYTDNS